MIFVYIFIIGMPCFLIFLIIKKMMTVKAIQQHGIATDAFITHVSTRRFNKTSMDILTLEYTDTAGRCHPAKATVNVGKYRVGQRMPVKYLRQNPARYAFDNRKTYWVILIFCILLLLFAIFASYKINEMMQAGNYY